jgi:DNA-binding transcriptional ArsR family regulator
VSETDRLFEAMADGTRRAAIEALIAAPCASGDLARRLAVSPQALSRHLRVLRRAGLVSTGGEADDARRRIYRIEPHALSPLRDWLDRAEAMWGAQLAAFKAFAENAPQ